MMNVMFENRTGQLRIIGIADNEECAYKVIDNFLCGNVVPSSKKEREKSKKENDCKKDKLRYFKSYCTDTYNIDENIKRINTRYNDEMFYIMKN